MKSKFSRRLGAAVLALALSLAAPGAAVYAADGEVTTMDFEVPGAEAWSEGGVSFEDGEGFLDQYADIVNLDYSDLNGQVFSLATFRGLYSGAAAEDELQEEVFDEVSAVTLAADSDTDESTDASTQVVIKYGAKRAVDWKISYANTVHTYPEFSVGYKKHIYCSFKYTEPSGKLYMGIADPNDKLSLKQTSGGTFTHTFVTSKAGGYHFVVANRGLRTIRVSGYFKVEE